MRTGIDQDHLDVAWATLNLQNDPDYIEMDKEYQKAMESITRNAKEQGKL